MKLPTMTLSEVYHVGEMKESLKKEGSCEGSGLSISLHPDEWREIARGSVCGNTYALRRDGAAFLNVHELNEKQRDAIVSFGIQNGYVEKVMAFQYTDYDDELDDEVYQIFGTYDEALEETNGDKNNIKEVEVIAPTQKLLLESNHDTMSYALTFDLLLPIFVEQVTEFDGVWWDDKLDVLTYSAPRGVILKSKLGDWSSTNIDNTPTLLRSVDCDFSA